MSELLKIVFSLSLSGTILFFIILALKPLYKNKLCKRWQYYIWLIVILRMLLPFTPETTLVGSAFAYLDNLNPATIQTAPYENEMQSDFSLNGSYIAPNAQAPRINLDTAPLRSIQAIFSKTNQAPEVYQEVKVFLRAIN